MKWFGYRKLAELSTPELACYEHTAVEVPLGSFVSQDLVSVQLLDLVTAFHDPTVERIDATVRNTNLLPWFFPGRWRRAGRTFTGVVVGRDLPTLRQALAEEEGLELLEPRPLARALREYRSAYHEGDITHPVDQHLRQLLEDGYAYVERTAGCAPIPVAIDAATVLRRFYAHGASLWLPRCLTDTLYRPNPGIVAAYTLVHHGHAVPRLLLLASLFSEWKVSTEERLGYQARMAAKHVGLTSEQLFKLASFDGERFRWHRDLTHVPPQLVETLDREGTAYAHMYGVNPIPGLEVQAILRVPSPEEAPRTTRPRSKLFRYPGFVLDSRQPLPIPAKVPVVDDPRQVRWFLTHTRNGLYLPDLAGTSSCWERLLAAGVTYVVLCRPRRVW